MSSESLTKIGATGRKDAPTFRPESLFVIGLDGSGDTEQERVDWLKSVFPKLADRIDALRDPRSVTDVPDEFVNACKVGVQEPVLFENPAAFFPDQCGDWGGKAFLPVVDGRQRTRALRIVNAERVGSGLPPYEILGILKKFSTSLMARQIKAVTNVRVDMLPSHRAALALEFDQAGVSLADIAPLIGVSSEQAVTNILALNECSAAVKVAVDAGQITQTSAIQIAKGKDHDAQDAELAKRLDAASGKKGRERSKALRGECQAPKPMKAKTIGKVTDRLQSIDRTTMSDPHRVDEWVAILRIVSGDESAYDALPDEFREALHRVRVGALKERKAKRGSVAGEGAANDVEKKAA